MESRTKKKKKKKKKIKTTMKITMATTTTTKTMTFRIPRRKSRRMVSLCARKSSISSSQAFCFLPEPRRQSTASLIQGNFHGV